ncbi:29944_t:CDS:2 [Racocetra persica]|uniref:29944_t:CDS:1 n=1 Tax=Racocetra persica TaxID=160502 RepID=A0ACA9NX27_9GLOM|nr:29944_t:CDS:2 [Racocetra persica]
MVAAVHNGSNSIYRLVEVADESYIIPAFEEEAHVNLIRAMEGESS